MNSEVNIKNNRGENSKHEIESRLDQIEQKIDFLSPNSIIYKQSSAAPHADDEIDLLLICKIIWAGKAWVLAFTLLFGSCAFLYSISLPNQYNSEALLAPSKDNSGGLGGIANSFGGLASLAGVSIGGTGDNKTTLAIEVLKSRSFIANFIEKNNLLVPLMASKDWSSEKGLIIDKSIYDEKKNSWVRKSSRVKPSLQEAYREFSKRMKVKQDTKTGFIKVGFEFYSPKLAREWVIKLVQDLNFEIKSRDISEARRTIKYLREELDKTSIADMRAIFYELIEEQTKTVMFAEVRNEYVLKTVDGAVVPENKSKPMRALVTLLGLFLGGVLGVLIIFIRYWFREGN